MDEPRTPTNTFDAPFDEEMERAVIGSVFINPAVFLAVSAGLRATDFFLLRHQYIWNALLAIHQRGEPLERQTLRRELESRDQWGSVGGDVYISELINSTPSAMYAQHYADLVAIDAERRELISAAAEIQGMARDKLLSIDDIRSKSQAALFKAAERSQTRDIVTMREAASDYYEHVEEMLQRGEKGMGMPTGFKKLDQLLGGLHRSDLLIFAGRPGMGKTSFLLSLTVNAAAHFGARVLVFTLEMGVDQLVDRMVALSTDINVQKLRTGNINQRESGLIIESLGRMSEYPVFIDDSPSLNPAQMRMKAQRVHYEHGLDLIVLDYVQLMNAPGYNGNRVAELSYITRQLKEMARELNVPLLSAAQLNRDLEKRRDKRPQLSDLKESGSLEQDADVVMFLYRDIMYNDDTENPNQADIIVAKHRNGPTDTIPLYFDPTTTKFSSGVRQVIDLSHL